MKIPLLLALVGTLGGASWAQGVPDAPVANPAGAIGIPELDNPADPTAKKTFKIALKNVKPSLMAYWLDPANHEWPQGFGKPPIRTLGNMLPVVPQGQAASKGVFNLPQGVDRIVAVDPQDSLLAFGTAQGVKELTQTIRFLDRPLRQVELEARFVRVSGKDLGAIFGGAMPVSAPLNTPQIGFKRGNFEMVLDDLVKSNKAVVLSAPRILAINNMTAEVNSSVNSPVELKGRDGQTKALDLPGGADLYLETNRSLSVTPTINNDETVTVLAQIAEDVQLKKSAASEDTLVLQKPGDAPQFVVNMRDGETIAVALRHRSDAGTPLQTTVLFLTARIVRRAGGDK